MIRKNLINCKLFDEKRSGKAILNDCMDHLDLQEEECPCCGNKGCLHVHAYYGRTLIDFVDEKSVLLNLCICRLICSECMSASTHAVLPDPIIPYCRHSLRFILQVLAEHALHLRSIEKICEAYRISLRTFYRWQKLFDEHWKEWQGSFASQVNDLKTSILKLFQKIPFSDFTAAFIRRTGFSFLQEYKNTKRLYQIENLSLSEFP